MKLQGNPTLAPAAALTGSLPAGRGGGCGRRCCQLFRNQPTGCLHAQAEAGIRHQLCCRLVLPAGPRCTVCWIQCQAPGMCAQLCEEARAVKHCMQLCGCIGTAGQALTRTCHRTGPALSPPPPRKCRGTHPAGGSSNRDSVDLWHTQHATVVEGERGPTQNAFLTCLHNAQPAPGPFQAAAAPMRHAPAAQPPCASAPAARTPQTSCAAAPPAVGGREAAQHKIRMGNGSKWPSRFTSQPGGNRAGLRHGISTALPHFAPAKRCSSSLHADCQCQ